MRFMRLLPVCVALLCVAACSKNDRASDPALPPLGATCVAGSTTPLPSSQSQSTDFKLQEVPGATGLPSPIDLQAPPGDARLFVAVRAGHICVVQSGVLLETPFLDISTRVYTVGEAGLISFAFDPNYATNGFVFVHFVENIPGTKGDIVVERYRMSSTNPNVLETPGTEVIRIPHREAANHYGGRVAFGPDGMLYLSTGDGGCCDNRFLHAQDAASLLGKMLRIDVSALNPSQVPPYTIPADNPVWPKGVGRNENWAIGLRNPFRYAFDGPQLYIADVGQNLFEEIDVVSASAAGLNYGWSFMEGKQCFQPASCDMTGLTLPVYDYGHGLGCAAVIGGYVYRGTAIPALQGKYLFSDFCNGVVHQLTLNSGVATVVDAPTANVGTPLSFGQDGAGEIYVLTGENRVLKIVAP